MPKWTPWGGGGPKVAASRTPLHLRAGRGAANRSAPTGGSAKAIPRNTATPFSRRPRRRPKEVRTTGWSSAWRSTSDATDPIQLLLTVAGLIVRRSAPRRHRDPPPPGLDGPPAVLVGDVDLHAQGSQSSHGARGGVTVV